MHGIPSRIATRADIEHLRSFIGTPFDTPEARAATAARLRELLATETYYGFARLLGSEAERAGPEPGCRVMTGQGVNGDEIHEFLLQDNPYSLVKRAGMTAGEIEALIEELA